MEEIYVTEEQKQRIIALFIKRKRLWIDFFVIGLVALIPTGFAVPYASSFIFFLVIGSALWSQTSDAIKKISNDEYHVYVTRCVRTKLGSVLVENSEIISKKVKKPNKLIEPLEPAKSFRRNEDVGIIQIRKNFWAFTIDTQR